MNFSSFDISFAQRSGRGLIVGEVLFSSHIYEYSMLDAFLLNTYASFLYYATATRSVAFFAAWRRHTLILRSPQAAPATLDIENRRYIAR